MLVPMLVSVACVFVAVRLNYRLKSIRDWGVAVKQIACQLQLRRLQSLCKSENSDTDQATVVYRLFLI